MIELNVSPNNNNMMILLPIFALFLLLYLSLKEITPFKNMDIRGRILTSFSLWSGIVVLNTEILSFFTYFTYLGLIISWTAIDAALSCVVFHVQKYKKTDHKPVFHFLQHVQGSNKLFLIGIVLIILFTGVLASTTAPNNPDSMSYHLARIEHWIQNRSVAYYPTNIQRQNYLSPGAEFIIAHLRILSGGDYFANLVQWGAFVLVILVISLLTKEMGGGYKEQIISALFVSTMPNAILQASSTQNDLIASLWLLCFVYFGIVTIKAMNIYQYIFSAIPLGLALFTKSTNYIFAFPFVVWFTIDLFRKNKKQLVIFLLSLASAVAILNFGYYQRNISFFGTPIGSSDTYTNSDISLPLLLSNSLKNAAAQFWTPFTSLNAAFFSFVDFLHKGIGLNIYDVSLNFNNQHFALPSLLVDENIAINPLHMFLILILGIWVVIKNPKKLIHPLVASLISASILFSLILRWQPWGTRLLLPLMILLGIPFGLFFHKVNTKVAFILGTILLMCSTRWILFNNMKPIISFNRSIVQMPRDIQYFNGDIRVHSAYSKAVSLIVSKKYKNIGFITDSEYNFEYPLFALLRSANYNTTIEHLEVNNNTAALTQKVFNPDFIVYIGSDQKIINKYSEEKKLPFIAIY